MRVFRYVSHPQVKIDPNVPVPEWCLSDAGRARLLAVCKSKTLKRTEAVFSSAERKAVEAAELLAGPLGLKPIALSLSHENDRSATGFLPPAEFEAVANQFFALPTQSIRGWERAIDAQARIVSVAVEVLRRCLTGDILMVGHGGVGTLLFCHFAGLPISRLHDQPANGGGNYWSMSLADRAILHGWRPIERLPE